MRDKTHLWVAAILGLLLTGLPAGAAAQITGELVNPNVMLLVDTSGSMDWLADGEGNASWRTAEAACRLEGKGDPNRRTPWQQLQDVLLGTIPNSEYRCLVQRPAFRPAFPADGDLISSAQDLFDNTREYREALYPHFRAVACDDADWNATYGQCIGNEPLDPNQVHDGVWCEAYENGVCFDMNPLARSRRTDGILERYRNVVRFGLMTYDNMPAPALAGFQSLPDPHDGLWNYGPSRAWRCKDWYYDTEGTGAVCTWNAGARADNADAIGRLVPIGDDLDYSYQQVRQALDTVEPLNCSPMGALIDDAGHYFHSHPGVKAAGDGGNDRYFWCRPKLAIFISDGQPTQAFEFPQDYCDDAPPLPPDDVPGDETYSCPWNSSAREASELFGLIDAADADPVLMVVIGFKVPDVDCAARPGECVQTTIAGDLLPPRQFLDEVAEEGWPSNNANVVPRPWSAYPSFPDGFSCPEEVCGSGGALFVETPEQLSAVLDMVIGMLTRATVTRTEVATTDQVSGELGDDSGFAPGGEIAQYEFNTGYETAAGLPWKGFLYRQGFQCAVDDQEGSGGAVSDPDPLHEWLNSQTIRRLYTVPRAKLPTQAQYNTIKTAWDTGQTNGGFLDLMRLIDDPELTDCDFGGPTVPDSNPDVLCEASTLIKDEVVEHLYGTGDSQRAVHRLADVYNSTPTVLGPPMERLVVDSYSTFKGAKLPGDEEKRMIQRVPHLFVGTNDGVLHAFDVWAGSDDEVESWGYVPNALLPTISRQFPVEIPADWAAEKDEDDAYQPYTVSTEGQYQHLFGVDGSPVTADVRLYRRPDMTADAESKYWHSVVLGGLGKGGRGYYCLDVTNPANPPGFRWEISPDSDANNPPGTFDGLGIPISRPALAYAYYETSVPGLGDSQAAMTEVAVAILPGGYWNDEANGPERSSGAYIVRAADGALVRYLDPSNAADICLVPGEGGSLGPAHDPLAAQLVGEPAVPQSARAALTAKEAFLGDDRGRLWRIDLTGTDPQEDWCLEMYFDTMLTSHFPYQDCLPGACEDAPSNYSSDECWAVDCCTGLDDHCPSAAYPYPRIPVVSAPTILQDRDRNNIILFGTGQIDGLETLDHHRIFSLKGRVALNVEGTAFYYHEKPTINWWLGEPVPTGALPDDADPDLQEQETEMLASHVWFDEDGSAEFDFFNVGEKLIGRPVVFDETAYFTTFIPTAPDADNACESGGSRIWSVDYDVSGAGVEMDDFGKWLVEGGEDSEDAFVPFMEYPGELLSGARVIRRPSCTGEPTFQVVAQKANTTPGSSAPPPPDQPRVQSVSIPITGGSLGFTTAFIDSWSLVFN